MQRQDCGDEFLSHFGDNTELGRSVNLLVSSAGRSVKPGSCSVAVNKAKCQVLSLGHHNLLQCSRLREKWLHSWKTTWECWLTAAAHKLVCAQLGKRPRAPGWYQPWCGSGTRQCPCPVLGTAEQPQTLGPVLGPSRQERP